MSINVVKNEGVLVWDKALIARYDLSGPRYTSYPTAPQFHDNFGAEQFKAAVVRSNAAAAPLSLYFHIPFCSRICYYCGCNKIVTANRKRAAPYLDRLFKEIEIQAALLPANRPVKQLHWGGGTPTYISDEQMRSLMAKTRQHFQLLDDDQGEYSIEVHPGDMDVGTIGVLREIGFNRLSMGVQDFDAMVQKAVNRFNSVAQVKELVDAARALKFHSISMDLIYGLPHQNWQRFNNTLDHIVELNPDRLSVFNYAHMPHLFKTQKQIDEKTLPAAAEKLEMMRLCTEKLLAAGYVFIGMDHFAKSDDELAVAQREGKLQRNFQGYSTHGDCDLFAFGVSAISGVNNTFAQSHKNVEDYYQALDAGQLPLARGFILSDDDLLRKAVISQLICLFRLDFKEIEQQFSIDFGHYFATELTQLQPMVSDGLVTIDPQGISVTAAGRLLIRRICMQFDAYAKKASSQIGYSKII